MLIVSCIRFMLLILLFTSLPVYAGKNNYVSEWVQKTLMETLSVSYTDTPEDDDAVQKKYSQGAWLPMTQFFHEEIKTIKDNRLIIHPKPLTEPMVEREEQCFSSNCWRVYQSYNIPELHMNVHFSLLVVSASPAASPPFLIQTVTLQVHRY